MSKYELDWDCQQAFLAVLESGSFSAAARQLNLSQPTIRNRIDQLEGFLGTPMFVRTSIGVSPTAQALALADPARHMDFAARHFQRAATGQLDRVSGTVRLSACTNLGFELVPALLAPLLAAHQRRVSTPCGCAEKRFSGEPGPAGAARRCRAESALPRGRPIGWVDRGHDQLGGLRMTLPA